MVRQPVTFGFFAEYLGGEAVYDEFEKYLRIEFEKRPAEWQASFGRVSRLDPATGTWNYAYLLSGDVPKAKSRREAEREVRGLVHSLGTGLRLTHPNPGRDLPEPRIRVWQW